MKIFDKQIAWTTIVKHYLLLDVYIYLNEELIQRIIIYIVYLASINGLREEEIFMEKYNGSA